MENERADTPALDQVADARRRLAAHARFPVAYWVLFGVFLVLVAGLPIWTSWSDIGNGALITWALAVAAIASVGYSWVRRQRSGVQLRRRITAYPSARPIWLAGLAVTAAGFFGIDALVHTGQRGIAFVVLPVVAVAVFASQVMTRSAMRRDIEAGRVRP